MTSGSARLALRPLFATLTGRLYLRQRHQVSGVVSAIGGTGSSFFRAVCLAAAAIDGIRHCRPSESEPDRPDEPMVAYDQGG